MSTFREITNENELLEFNMDNMANELNELLVVKDITDDDDDDGDDLSVGDAAICSEVASYFFADNTLQQLQCKNPCQYEYQYQTPALGAMKSVSSQKMQKLATPVSDHANDLLFNLSFTSDINDTNPQQPTPLYCQDLNDLKTAPPLINRALLNKETIEKRKSSKEFQQDVELPAIDSIDVDRLMTNINSLGPILQDTKKNIVDRLFELFRHMHYFLDDEFPFPTPIQDYDQLVYLKPPMPSTLCVQLQVKSLARKCAVFVGEMQRLLTANKQYDHEKYIECELSLKNLRMLFEEFNVFKNISLEHKNGEFLTEFALAQAAGLEALMEKMNDQIRETHLYIHVFNWAMERKYKKTESAAAMAVSGTSASGGAWMPTVGQDNNGGGDDNQVNNNANDQSTPVMRRARRCMRFIG